MNLKAEKITELAPIINDRVIPFEGERPYLSTGGLYGNSYNTVNVLFNEKPSRADLNILPDDIIMARMQFTPKVFQATELESDLIISTGFVVFRPNKEKLFPKFLYHYLKSEKFQYEKNRRCTGATQKAINNSKINELEIPFPKYDDQTRIAGILDKADTLRKKRKVSIKLLDDFLRSTFLEMFGDPMVNKNSFPIHLLGNLSIKIGSGSTPKGGSKIYQTDGVMFLRSQNILMNEMFLDNVAFISDSIHNNMEGTWVKNGDVLLNITGASIGRVAYFHGKDNSANVNQHVCIIRPLIDKLNPVFLSFMISQKNYQSKILSENTGGTREAFNFKKISGFDIPLPPINLQNKFADIVQQTEKLKAKYKESETELNNLFGSLMQRAFKGEL